MTSEALAPSRPLIRPDTAEALVLFGVAILAVVVSVSAFAVSTIFGVAATFVLTLVLAIVMPAGIPLLIATSFVLQNTVVAWYTPYIGDVDTFDAMRSSNFIIVMTAFAAFLAAAFQAHIRSIAPLRPWLIGGIALCGLVTLYFALGAIAGDPKDAVVYFRNILTPIACFYIAIIAASVYRIDLTRTLTWLAALAIVYGYCELTFRMEFLGLFNGDDYVQQSLWKQILDGTWEKTLEETGFVLRGIDDVMMTNFFNLSIFADLPMVFRVGGPSFHPIAFAYLLSIVSAWLLFQRRWFIPLFALPLLVIVGSKGAMVLLLMAICARIGIAMFGVRPAMILTVIGGILWVGASIVFGMDSGDYHVLGFFAGVRDFLGGPQGVGLGIGGNLSSTALNINWQQAQETGAAEFPMESAIGVLLYQMGVAAFAFLGFVGAVGWAAYDIWRRTGHTAILWLTVATIVISANAVLQEEAYFSPLALGLALLLGGVGLGSYWNPRLQFDHAGRFHA